MFKMLLHHVWQHFFCFRSTDTPVDPPVRDLHPGNAWKLFSSSRLDLSCRHDHCATRACVSAKPERSLREVASRMDGEPLGRT
ncbi:hypothetical protein ACP90_02390 [Labrenzia sp. CP4]|nr:hypothetical protein ACP90_02390 [Labrenzia sp. CP4]